MHMHFNLPFPSTFQRTQLHIYFSWPFFDELEIVYPLRLHHCQCAPTNQIAYLLHFATFQKLLIKGLDCTFTSAYHFPTNSIAHSLWLATFRRIWFYIHFALNRSTNLIAHSLWLATFRRIWLYIHFALTVQRT